jgi:hypothetical protein
MITVPAGLRVLIATKPVDFRNYAEGTIMLSPRRRTCGRRD